MKVATVVVGPRLLEGARQHMHAIRLAQDCPGGRIVDDDELAHLLGQDQLAVHDGLQFQRGPVCVVGGRHGQLTAGLGLEALGEGLRNRARFATELGLRLQPPKVKLVLGLRINPDQQGVLRAAAGLDLDNAHPARSQSADLGILRQPRSHDRRIERFRLEQVTALRGDQQVGLARLQRDQVGVGRGN